MSSNILSTLPFFTPTQIAGCQLWLDATDRNSLLITGSNVTQWNDKSGNARNYTQTTSANQPLYGLYNSYPGVFFNGAASQNLSNSYIQTGSGGRNTFIVFYDVNTNANQFGNPVLFYMANTNQSALGDWRAAYDGANNYLGTDVLAGAYLYRANPNVTTMRTSRTIALWGIQSGAGLNTGYVYGNGTQFTTLVNSFASTSPINVQNSGTTSIGGGQTGYATAVISEVIYYSTDITSLQRQQVEGYLAWKWGLQGSLPATHPFRRSPFGITVPPSMLTRIPQQLVSPSPPFIPTSIPGCAFWFDAADSSSTILSGGQLIQWNDKSGNRQNMTVVGTQSNTTISSNAQNNLNVLNLTGRNLYRTPINSGIYPSDCYFVVASKALARTDFLAMGNTTSDNFNSLTLGEHTALRWHNGSSGFLRTPLTVSPTNETSTGFLLMNWSLANNNYVLRRNTLTLSQTAAYTYTLGGNPAFQIGFRHTDRNNSELDCNAFIAEIIVYNTQLAVSQRQQIEGYLAWKWGLQANLPLNHPFRESPPSTPVTTIPFTRQLGIRNFSPLSLPGCALWLDAADAGTVTTTGTTVSAWRDKSGSANNAIFDTNRPTYVPSNRFLETSNNNTFIQLPAAAFTNTGGQTAILFIVYADKQTGTNNQGLFSTSDLGLYQLLRTPTYPAPYAIRGNMDRNNVQYTRFRDQLNTTNTVIYSLQYTSGIVAAPNYSGGVNGIVWNPASQNTQSVAGNLFLGGINNFDTAGSIYSNLTINEVISFRNVVLTVFQRQQVEGYLAWKWGLQGSLPSNHPYKKWPPLPS